MSNFRRTRIAFDVLSEETIHPYMDLDAIVSECDTGGYVMGDVERTDEALTGEEMANALVAAGGEPGFFRLNPDGSPEDPDDA